LPARHDRRGRCKREGAPCAKTGIDFQERLVDHEQFVDVADQGRVAADLANKERLTGRGIAARL
jgi:hypothetical protein